MVHANNDEMLTVTDWRAWVETHLCPVVGGLRGQRVHKEIYLAVGNEALAPWHVDKFGGRLAPCMREVCRFVGARGHVLFFFLEQQRD